jgi:hypothetical protein
MSVACSSDLGPRNCCAREKFHVTAMRHLLPTPVFAVDRPLIAPSLERAISLMLVTSRPTTNLSFHCKSCTIGCVDIHGRHGPRLSCPLKPSAGFVGCHQHCENCSDNFHRKCIHIPMKQFLASFFRNIINFARFTACWRVYTPNAIAPTCSYFSTASCHLLSMVGRIAKSGLVRTSTETRFEFSSFVMKQASRCPGLNFSGADCLAKTLRLSYQDFETGSSPCSRPNGTDRLRSGCVIELKNGRNGCESHGQSFRHGYPV